MADGPKRRMLDQVGGSPTLIAQGSRIMGDIETAGALIVFGAIRGDGRVRGALSMAAESAWEGEVWAQQAIIAGTVVGRLSVDDKLEIGATAVIRAQVSARSIAIAKGAVIEGQVTVTSGESVVSFEEKRQA
jgi:cytoskeletal protein CcmA (bactofilin family)